MRFNTQKITLITVLFMGYLTSGFLRLIFPFSVSISIIWTAIMMEYLGYSVFLYYTLYNVPFILNDYIGIQQFENALIKMSPELSEHIETNLTTFLGFMFYWGFVIFYSWLIHRILRKSGCFPRTII